MGNSILHAGSKTQNLGNIYKNTWRTKDTFGMYSQKETPKQNKLNFYLTLRDIGRMCFEKKERFYYCQQLQVNFKNSALTEKTILKILDAYYCVYSVAEGQKRAYLQIQLSFVLKKMKLRSSVIQKVLDAERSPLTSPDKKQIKRERQKKSLEMFYQDLHHFLLKVQNKNIVVSDYLAKEFRKQGRNEEMLEKLIKAYSYKVSTKKSLQIINEKYNLGLNKKDIKYLERLW